MIDIDREFRPPESILAPIPDGAGNRRNAPEKCHEYFKVGIGRHGGSQGILKVRALCQSIACPQAFGNNFVSMARSERFELPTLGIEIRCSIQLSYERFCSEISSLALIFRLGS